MLSSSQELALQISGRTGIQTQPPQPLPTPTASLPSLDFLDYDKTRWHPKPDKKPWNFQTLPVICE